MVDSSSDTSCQQSRHLFLSVCCRSWQFSEGERSTVLEATVESGACYQRTLSEAVAPLFAIKTPARESRKSVGGLAVEAAIAQLRCLL